MKRRKFTGLTATAGSLALLGPWAPLRGAMPKSQITTVTGPINASRLGTCLCHEHLLVDFIGATETGYHRWDRNQVIDVLKPHIERLLSDGCQTFFDCTPAYLGRDPVLLYQLSVATGLQIVTNTGYYGAVGNKYLPAHAFAETADQLSARWIREWKGGIEDTSIKPGFIKIGIDEGPLSEIHRKLVVAAARTHLATGLTIAAHTGTAVGAFEELDVLAEEGVRPDAFIWVHAQAEKDYSKHIKAAELGAWISFDGVSEESIGDYTDMLRNMKESGLLHRVLISHDAGWYSPGEPGGGDFRDFSAIFRLLLPEFRQLGFSTSDIDQLLVFNPQHAFTVAVRKS